MDHKDRLAELRELDATSGDILSSDYRFAEWQGRVYGLLGFNVVTRLKFESICDEIQRTHTFGGPMLSMEVKKLEEMLHIVLTRAIADLELNAEKRSRQRYNAAQPLKENSEIVKAQDKPTSFKGITIPESMTLEKEKGLVWFLHHCHYSVKYKMLGSAILFAAALMSLGWIANEQEFIRDIAKAVQKLQNPQPTAHAPAGLPDPGFELPASPSTPEARPNSLPSAAPTTNDAP